MSRWKKRRRLGRRGRFVLRVTPAGWIVFLISLIVGIAAARSGMPMMFMIFGCLFAGLLLSSPIARSNVAGIVVRRELPERMWQYETLTFGYHLYNKRLLFSCVGVELSEVGSGAMEEAGGYCPSLPNRVLFSTGNNIFAGQRGEIHLEGVRLVTRFPLGLVKARREIYSPASLLVWPARGKLKSDILHKEAMHSTSLRPGRRSGGQDEFFGMKEYRQGDNPRWIHWRRSAGRPVPVLREMAHPDPDVLFIILDIAGMMNHEGGSERMEYLLRFAATMIVHSLGRNYQVGMVTSSGGRVVVVPPGSSMDTRRELLDALSRVGNERHDIGALMQQVPGRYMRHSKTMLISDERSRAKLQTVRLPSRETRLIALGPAEIGRIYEDHALAGKGGEDADQ